MHFPCRQKINLPLVLLFGFLLQFFIYQQGIFEPVTNYRLVDGSLIHHGLNTAAKWKGMLNPEANLSFRSDDDPGPVLVLASIFHLTLSKEQITNHSWENPPDLYFLLMGTPYLFFLLLICLVGEHLQQRKIFYSLAAIVFFSKLGSFLAFSGDVYYFPIFSFGLFLCWYSSLIRHPRLWYLGAIVGIGFFVSDLFRSSGTLLLPGVLLLVWKPQLFGIKEKKLARRSAALLFLTFVGTKLLLAPPVSHPVWYSIHAGFFEQGGWVDKETREAFPAFMKIKTEKSISTTDWDDRIQELLVQKIDPNFRLGKNFQPQHEAFFKEEVMAILQKYPKEVALLISTRLWSLLEVNPWISTYENSRVRSSSIAALLAKVVFLFLLLAGIYLGVMRERGFLALFLCLPLGIPPLLVHSGYLIYNGPMQIVGLGIALYSLALVIESVQKKWQR